MLRVSSNWIRCGSELENWSRLRPGSIIYSSKLFSPELLYMIVEFFEDSRSYVAPISGI